MEQTQNQINSEQIEVDIDTITSESGNTFTIDRAPLSSEQLRAAVQMQPHEKSIDGVIKRKKKEEQEKQLTPKQRMFVSLVVKGLSPKEAYRKSYSATTENEATIGAAANRLMNLPKVKRLLEANWNQQEKNIIMDQQRTRLHIMEELLTHSGNDKVPISARLKALELMGKAVGMFTDKIETKVEQISADQLKNELSQHLDLLDSYTKH